MKNMLWVLMPSHETMVLFVLRKLILQTFMRSHPTGLDVWFFVRPFVYFHTSCVRTAKALARQRKCAGSPKPSLVAYVMYLNLMNWLICFYGETTKSIPMLSLLQLLVPYYDHSSTCSGLHWLKSNGAPVIFRYSSNTSSQVVSKWDVAS